MQRKKFKIKFSDLTTRAEKQICAGRGVSLGLGLSSNAGIQRCVASFAPLFTVRKMTYWILLQISVVKKIFAGICSLRFTIFSWG